MGTMKALGYIRVSTADQVDSGAGLAAQRRLIEAECARRGWSLAEVVCEDEGISAKTLARPALQSVLTRLNAGEADALIAAKLDRVSRSVSDFSNLMTTANKRGWTLLVLDCSVDTTTPAGKAMAHMLATFAQWEREIIGQRTKDALAAKKAEGVSVGRPRSLDATVRERIIAARERGHTPTEIANELNAAGVPTAHGGRRWYAGTVARIAD